MLFIIDPISAAITGGTSVINGILNRKSVKDTNKTNMAIAQANNEAMLQAMRENNQWSKDTAKEFFDMENAYNDPSAARERMEAAGYNPFFGNNSSMVNSGDASTPTAQVVPALQAPTLSPVPSVLNGALTEITNAMVNVANAKKTGVETKNAESMISRQIRQMDINNEWNNFLMELDKWFSWSDRNWQNEQNRLGVSKTSEEINSLVQDVLNKQKQGQIYDADLAIKNFEKIVAKSQSEWIPKQLKQEFVNAVKQGNAIDAAADASRASAAQSRSQSSYIDRQKSLLGKSINGVEVDQNTLNAWKEQVKNSAISENQKAKIQQALNAIEANNAASYVGQLLYSVKDAFRYLPVLGDVLDTIVKYAK